ncbi:hypothetical protein [Mesorhizobium sp.]|uniref:hypothetical protein n=1 Tax=Mesorhizobium sp. TaxID=1871066 RepID=UPI0025BFE1B1|nr:hypothetical protein [Mesorhizobium sp.]
MARVSGSFAAFTACVWYDSSGSQMQPATVFCLLVICSLAYVVYRCTKKLVDG